MPRRTKPPVTAETLLTPSQEAFAQAIARDEPKGLSYRNAYPGNTSHDHVIQVRARELALQPHVAARIAELQAIKKAVADETYGVNRGYIISNLKTVAERCMDAVEVTDKKGNPTGEWTFDSGGAISALEKLGKHIGMWPNKVQVDSHVTSEHTETILWMGEIIADPDTRRALDALAARLEGITRSDGGKMVEGRLAQS